ncbi:THUMP-like domain-containing protein [Flavobacterium sp.]|uniref:THUMP-like domain-containing protein n=1 Tax=Flavobacterium sp. TaxID=239 RepID=UPI002FDCBF71
MNHALVSAEIQDFIRQNTKADVPKLALQKNPFAPVEWHAILEQISAKQKAETKLPTWFQTKNIIYPSKISVEQTSSEKTAAYKATLISGNRLIDMSGGFGIDDYYFAKKMSEVIHCEINSELSEIVAHNCKALKVTNIRCIAGDSTEILKQQRLSFDWMYIDPSRRNDTKGKVFMLRDCLPNVPENLDLYFDYTRSVLIKTAPLLDITAGLAELKYVKAIHVVALDNDVKELLWILEKNYHGSVKIIAVNITKEATDSFSFDNSTTASATFDLPKQYLYEPNAAIMKSGGFDEVSTQFNIAKLHPHSHLYTSNTLLKFPGRCFVIEKCVDYTKNEMKHLLTQTKANVTVRNFPETVDTIRKKWKIKEGGDRYCFFTTDKNNRKIVLLCTKL